MVDAAHEFNPPPPQALAADGGSAEPPQETLPAPENKTYYPALDGLRAIAVMMVFFEHYLTKYDWMRWGWTGVDLFFVLSGFLITGILYDTRHATRRFSTFYMRRTLRIFPLYYGVLLLLLLLGLGFHGEWQPVFSLYPFYLANYGRFLFHPAFVASHFFMERLLIQVPLLHTVYLPTGHFWTLSLEEQFYLVWPLVVFSIPDRKRLIRVCVALCIAIFCARAAFALVVPERIIQIGVLYFLTPLRVDALLLGGLAALIYRGEKRALLLRTARHAVTAFASLFVLFEVGYFFYFHKMYEVVAFSDFFGTFGFLLIDLFAVALMLYSLEPGTPLFRFLNLRPLRWLGSISYGFYILHDLPHMIYVAVIFRLFPHTPFIQTEIALLAFCSTTLLAWLSFRFYETPFLRLKSRFTVR